LIHLRMTKIYFNDKPLLISAEVTEEVQTYLDNPSTVIIRSIETPDIKKLIATIQEPNKAAGVIISDEAAALEEIKKHFLLIQAAGGLVYTNAGELLLICRRGKWDLPKGKLDEGENLEECAVREVEEETGLQQTTLKRPLCITYHTYKQDGQFILKESHWYLMQVVEEQVLTPQMDEDIEKCEWVGMEKLDPYLENTHPSIMDVLKRGTEVIRENVEAKP
jgi:8-oxo-dGTP pyrophosphatase MutT (NUDIX family)